MRVGEVGHERTGGRGREVVARRGAGEEGGGVARRRGGGGGGAAWWREMLRGGMGVALAEGRRWREWVEGRGRGWRKEIGRAHV